MVKYAEERMVKHEEGGEGCKSPQTVLTVEYILTGRINHVIYYTLYKCVCMHVCVFEFVL